MAKYTRLIKLTLDELDAQADEFNQLAMASSELDRFCSSTHWIIPAHQAFSSTRPTWIHRSDAGYVALAMGYRLGHGIVLEPLEAVWGLACPFVSVDPEALVKDFARDHLASRRQRIPLLLCGLVMNGTLFNLLCQELSPRMQLSLGRTTRSYRARLDDGVDGFLSRRSAKFRTNLRRSQRLAQKHRITFEYLKDFDHWLQVHQLYERILRTEQVSWKGAAGTGLGEPAMEDFYRAMIARIWSHGSIRAIIARQDGEDVGFCFGAVFHKVYRGLQMSFDDRLWQISLGNLLQFEMIQRLTEEGCDLYDLGVEVAYKERWSDDILETIQLLAV